MKIDYLKPSEFMKSEHKVKTGIDDSDYLLCNSLLNDWEYDWGVKLNNYICDELDKKFISKEYLINKIELFIKNAENLKYLDPESQALLRNITYGGILAYKNILSILKVDK